MTNTELREFNGTVVDGEQIFDEDVSEKDLLVKGNAVFCEDVEASNLEIVGDTEVKGLVTCDKLNVGGSLKCGHNLVIETGEISGSLECFGKINAEILAVYGKASSGSSVKANELDISGDFSCVKKLHSEKISVVGTLHVTGIVIADDMTFSSAGCSSADVIDTEKLTVREPVVKTESDNQFLLCATTANCGTARLKKTKIQKLSCTKADIGPGCEIDELYCKEKPKISSQALVRKVVTSEE